MKRVSAPAEACRRRGGRQGEKKRLKEKDVRHGPGPFKGPETLRPLGERRGKRNIDFGGNAAQQPVSGGEAQR